VSPAEHLLDLVRTAAEGVRAFEDVTARVIDRIKEQDIKKTAEDMKSQAFSRITPGISEFTLSTSLDQLRQTIADIEALTPAAGAAAPGLSAAMIPGGLPALRQAPVGRSIAAGARRAAGVVELAPLVLITVALMLVAVVAVLATQYFPNTAFGSCSDYVGLFTSAFGSAQAVAILAALLLVRGPAEWYGSSA
jgi:hypothetical protein